MKSNKLLYSIIGLLLLVVGFLAGSKSAETGRFVNTSDFAFTTDTKEGKIYIMRVDDYIVIDLKNGEKKTVKFKHIKQ